VTSGSHFLHRPVHPGTLSGECKPPVWTANYVMYSPPGSFPVMSKTFRIETDTMGKMKVPSDRYYGCQTARSLVHFDVGIEKMPRELIRALGILKKAAALTNKDLGLLDPKLCKAICSAADEVISGTLD